jgi:hypothetical protein
MARYRRVGTTEAVPWTGENLAEVRAWAAEHLGDADCLWLDEEGVLIVRTPEGDHPTERGGWVAIDHRRTPYPVSRLQFARGHDMTPVNEP